MRIVLVFILLPLTSWSQGDNFPTAWKGVWKGELHWFTGNEKVPKGIPMELHIKQQDTADQYSWQLIYGSATEDNRPYTLKPKDAAKGHWVIDENNGIILDVYLVANRLSAAFSVQGSTIFNNYWMENDSLYVEFYSISAKPVAVTGKGTSDSPLVNSYQVKSYQKAVLSRIQ
jgi:hypothetical protein